MRLRMFAAPMAALVASTLAGGASGAPANLVATGDFDFYVLTLSWSPGQPGAMVS